MKKFFLFLFGMLVGAGLLYGAQTYHIVRSDEGLVLIPKLSTPLSDTYVDIRQFGAADWAAHKALTAAILKADRGKLLKDSVVKKAHEKLDDVLQEFEKLGQ